MQRFTISLGDALAVQFDALIAAKGYDNRSEAVRDLIRTQIDESHLKTSTADWCVASINYVYSHEDRTVAERVLSLQHDHHDLVITSLHTHLGHQDCLETVVLRGPVKAVRLFSQTLIALRGVRHGNIHVVPLGEDGHSGTHTHTHTDTHGQPVGHVHLQPLS